MCSSLALEFYIFDFHSIVFVVPPRSRPIKGVALDPHAFFLSTSLLNKLPLPDFYRDIGLVTDLIFLLRYRLEAGRSRLEAGRSPSLLTALGSGLLSLFPSRWLTLAMLIDL
jgi:hypothetical protein